MNRRTVLAGAGAVAVVAAAAPAARSEGTAAPPAADTLDPKPRVPTAQFEEAFAGIVGAGTPIEGRMTITLPEDAENGNIVPYRIAIESPMTDEDNVTRAYLLSTQNPQAVIATFHFTPLSGEATVSGRMRLAKTQDVVALALTSDNTLLVARQLVHVGIGGCGVD